MKQAYLVINRADGLIATEVEARSLDGARIVAAFIGYSSTDFEVRRAE